MMKSLRLQLAMITLLWIAAEGWFVYYWWQYPGFSRVFPSVGIPVAAMAMVMMVWALLRHYVIESACRSIQGKISGIALILTASVLGGFAPHLLREILAEGDLSASFHGEAGWPAFMCSIALWMLGAMYFLWCLIEILMKNESRKASR